MTPNVNGRQGKEKRNDCALSWDELEGEVSFQFSVFSSGGEAVGRYEHRMWTAPNMRRQMDWTPVHAGSVLRKPLDRRKR